ncbi:hypothetical protein NKI15_19935 [Mesorhizobium sp. M0862]|uniref:hypothetical protein n=1 Tax=Mesorhizobium sp. M0862 TaxID=2957015 RepID=UPI00333C2C0B
MAVANHPVLTSGVGACILAVASTESAMGVFLASIRWQHAPAAVEAWSKLRTVRGKLDLIEAEASLASSGHKLLAVKTLDKFITIATRRNKLAHGFFGIVTDREDQFAWRDGAAAGRTMADGLATSSMRPDPTPPTWIYTPRDFSALAQDCADTFDLISRMVDVLPIIHAFSERSASGA